MERVVSVVVVRPASRGAASHSARESERAHSGFPSEREGRRGPSTPGQGLRLGLGQHGRRARSQRPAADSDTHQSETISSGHGMAPGGGGGRNTARTPAELADSVSVGAQPLNPATSSTQHARPPALVNEARERQSPQ